MNETQLENLALNWFAETGWQTQTGPEIAPDSDRPLREDYKDVLLEEPLKRAILRINSGLPDAAVDEAIHKLKTVDHPVPVQRNRRFHKYLTDGIAVEVNGDEDQETELVRLIDFSDPKKNEFLAVNQFTIQGTKQPRRPDIVLFINGLPLAVLELKNPENENTDVWSAFRQVQTYKDEIADLFTYNVANVISDGWLARIGSLTANQEWYMPWKVIEHEDDKPAFELELQTVIKGFFKPELLLDYIRHFVIFEQEGDSLIKKIAGYHQFHAVREAVRAVISASDIPDEVPGVMEPRATYADDVKPGSKKGGVVWHTQGSGKSISMVCFAGKLLQQPEMKNPTIVVVTDRNDLDGQLYQTFSVAQDLLKQKSIQTDSREDLRDQLLRRSSGGIFFTTVQKFGTLDGENRHPVLSERHNVVVISDEAHRSQYGLKATYDGEKKQYKYGYARHLRDALPNATFIGFTGVMKHAEILADEWSS